MLQFRLLDRFGDNGVVSVMLFRRDAARPRTLELANWVMSCRVFGRRLEHEALNIAVEMALAQGVDTFVAEYVPSPKNGVVGGLYEQLGFRSAGCGADRPDATRWELALGEYRPHATHIARVKS